MGEIFSQGYQKWNGTLHRQPVPVLAVASLEARLAVKRVVLWITFGLAMLWIMLQLGLFYVAVSGVFGIQPSVAQVLGSLEENLAFIFKFITPILVALLGGASIARDRKHNAHLLYFSRTLGPVGYLAGKSLALGAIVLGLTGVPALLFFAVTMPRMTGVVDPMTQVHLFLACVAHAGLFTVYYLAAVLAFSSLTKNQTIPAILFLAFIWILSFFGFLFDIVDITPPGGAGIVESESRPSIDGEGRPVARVVENLKTSTVVRTIVLERPGDFDPEAWLATDPSDWRGNGGEPGHPMIAMAGSSGYDPRLASDPEGRVLVGAVEAGVVLVWDGRTGRRIATHEISVHTTSPIAVSPDGRSFVAVAGELQFRSVDSGEVELSLEGISHPVRSMAFEPSGEWFAVAAGTGVAVWERGRSAPRFVTDEPRVAVAAAADGALAAIDAGGKIEFLDPATGRPRREVELAKEALRSLPGEGEAKGRSPIAAFAFSPDGSLVAWGTEDGEVGLSEVESGQLVRSERHHSGRVNAVRFEPEGRVFLSAGRDGALLSFDGRTGRYREALSGKSAADETPSPFEFLAASEWVDLAAAGGDELAAIGSEGAVQVVDPAEGKKTRQLIGRAWRRMAVRDLDLEWRATPYEWLRVASPFALVGRTAEALYPTAPAERSDLAAAVGAGRSDPPAIALPWWQVAPIWLAVVAGGYAIVLRRLRSFERSQG